MSRVPGPRDTNGHRRGDEYDDEDEKRQRQRREGATFIMIPEWVAALRLPAGQRAVADVLYRRAKPTSARPPGYDPSAAGPECVLVTKPVLRRRLAEAADVRRATVERALARLRTEGALRVEQRLHSTAGQRISSIYWLAWDAPWPASYEGGVASPLRLGGLRSEATHEISQDLRGEYSSGLTTSRACGSEHARGDALDPLNDEVAARSVGRSTTKDPTTLVPST